MSALKKNQVAWDFMESWLSPPTNVSFQLNSEKGVIFSEWSGIGSFLEDGAAAVNVLRQEEPGIIKRRSNGQGGPGAPPGAPL